MPPLFIYIHRLIGRIFFEQAGRKAFGNDQKTDLQSGSLRIIGYIEVCWRTLAVSGHTPDCTGERRERNLALLVERVPSMTMISVQTKKLVSLTAIGISVLVLQQPASAQVFSSAQAAGSPQTFTPTIQASIPAKTPPVPAASAPVAALTPTLTVPQFSVQAAPMPQVQFVQAAPTPVQTLQFVQAAPAPVQTLQFVQAAPAPVQTLQFVQAAPAPVQTVQMVQAAPAPVQTVQMVQAAPAPVQTVQMVQAALAPVQTVQMVQAAPVQVQATTTPVQLVQTVQAAPVQVVVVKKKCCLFHFFHHCDSCECN
jgi:hypothetical protein